MPLTDNDLNQISSLLNQAVAGLATKEALSKAVAGLATKEALSKAVAGLATKQALSEALAGLATRAEMIAEFEKVKEMFGEDYEAESNRVSRIDRRLKKLRQEFNAHLVNQSIHNT